MKRLTNLALMCLFFFITPLFVSAATFNPNMILTDAELTNYTSMDMNAIKNFLTDKGSFLANYVEPNVRMYVYQIIYEVAQVYRINPKYLLVLLQKEQGLITNSNPSQGRLDWATGYGCPDGSAGNPKYQGLANQIDWGAGGTRYVFDHPEKFNYQVGQTYTISDTQVTIANDATRALYVYTPHIQGNKNLFTLWNSWFSTTRPDGSLLQNVEDGGIWLIENNKRRPFLTKTAFASRYSFDKVIEVKQADLEKYEIGEPIQFANYSLLRKPSGEIYLLDNEILRQVENMEAFRLLGFNPEEVVETTEDDLKNFKLGEPIGVGSAYPTGALLQDNSTGGVYYVKNGVKYPIWSKILMKLYYADKKLTAVSPEELEQYPTGGAVKLQEGELVKAKDVPTVYVISAGLKRPIANAETFESLGYKWSNIITLDKKILNLHSTGAEVLIEN
ncbi:MAG TPA: hypothetical protein ENN45_00520 [Bacteroidetes bacterium]|nr:hypothetical protein [Bacteroidota bacterium]